MMRLSIAKKRVTSLERLPQTDEVDKQIIDARTALGLYMTQMDYHIEAKEAIDPIIDLAINTIIRGGFPRYTQYLAHTIVLWKKIIQRRLKLWKKPLRYPRK